MYYQTHFKKIYLCILSLFCAFLIVLSAIGKAGESVKTSAASENRCVTVLMYHSVCINRKVNSEYILAPEKFRADMEYLKKRNCNFVSLPEIYDFYTGKGNLPENAVAITFDDGFLNNLSCVLPTLKELGIRANINVVGSYAQKYSVTTDRNASYACLTWDDITELKNSGLIEIGSHTWDMHSLGTRKGCSRKRGETEIEYKAALQSDIRRVNTALKENCGITPLVFAYPYGEMSPESKEVLYGEGFRVLLTCEEKVNIIEPDSGDLLILGRFNRAASLSTEEFMKKVGL